MALQPPPGPGAVAGERQFVSERVYEGITDWMGWVFLLYVGIVVAGLAAGILAAVW